MRFVLIKLMLFCLLTIPLQAQTQIGGGVCTNSSFSGIYFYLLSGNSLLGSQLYPYVELGKLVADGQGSVSGNSHASVGGSISAYNLVGTYSVQSSCTGSMTLSVNSQPSRSLTFQMVNGGQGAIIAFSSSSGVIAGRAYRQTASTRPIQCGTASLSGSYAYLLTGAAYLSGNGYYYSQAGSATGDGRGNMSATGMINVSGTTLTTTGQGPYSMASDCSGTASIRNQNGTANYFIAVVEDGQAVLFMESDTGYSVAGVAQPVFVAPQRAVINAASFEPDRLSPGALFSIFGSGLSAQSSTSTQVLVNGKVAPVLFVSDGQINAQLPFETPTGRPVSLSVVNAGRSSNAVAVDVHQAAPGVFTFGQNRAVVQNPDWSVNSPGNPAHAGDIVVVYLTGGGPVSPGVSTGALAPASPLAWVNSPYSFTIGGLKAEASYFGLTPGFIGLYQANLRVPVLSTGDYPVVATTAGVSSNGPVISVSN